MGFLETTASIENNNYTTVNWQPNYEANKNVKPTFCD